MEISFNNHTFKKDNLFILLKILKKTNSYLFFYRLCSTYNLFNKMG